MLACHRAAGVCRRLLSTGEKRVRKSKKSNDEAKQEGPEPVYAGATELEQGRQLFHLKTPFRLHYGGVLPELQLAFETWGQLDASKSNAILLHTGLSASSHARSHALNPQPGWWEKFIGPGRALDTNRFFVICTNVLGGCYGSTGPSSVNPQTGRRYGSSFPLIAIEDMIHAQMLLVEQQFGVKRLYASVGASMGGMQSLALAVLYPKSVQKLVTISACARTPPSAIAQRFCQRSLLMSDPAWNGGDYYDGDYPIEGMRLARQIATITYRSGPEWNERFARKKLSPYRIPSPFQADFEIESYLEFQSRKFSLLYDPNSLLYISKAMDLFDLGVPRGHGHGPDDTDLKAGLSRVVADTLVVGVKTDVLFPVEQQREIAQILHTAGNDRVTYYEIDAPYGHDTFLIDSRNIGSAVKGHLELDHEHSQSTSTP